MSQSFRQLLRAETRPVHQELDELVSSRRPFDSAETYSRFLTGMLCLHQIAGDDLGWAEQRSGLHPRGSKLEELILSDLNSIGDGNGSRLAVLTKDEMQEGTTNEDSECSRWGRAYVIAGSALGGQMMAREAKEKLAAPLNIAYLEQLSFDAKNRWPAFVRSFSQVSENFDSKSKQECIDAANGLFKKAILLFTVS